MDARTAKGMEIAATMPLRRDAKGWIVPSQSGPGSYRVAPNPTFGLYRNVEGFRLPAVGGLGCTCPDYELRGQPCKHVIAVEFTIRRETVDVDGSVVTEEVKVTYTQDWRAYNASQCAEGRMFLPMLADLCGTLSRPYSGRGRPSLPLSDMAYHCIGKVYSGLSARRYDSDVAESVEDGHADADPHFNTVLRYLRDPRMTDALTSLVTLSALPLRGVETTFAQDSTGFSTCRYTRWFDHKWGKQQVKREWVKLHAMVGTVTNVVTDAVVTDGWAGDSPQFVPMLTRTAENFPVAEVSADKAYSSKANLQAAVDLGATPYVPFKANGRQGPVPAIHTANIPALPGMASAWTKMYHLFAYQRDTFLSHYHRRSNVETTFSMIKRKFGDALRSKSDVGQVNEVLCKVIAHNLCVIISAIHEMGLPVPAFCTENGTAALEIPPAAGF